MIINDSGLAYLNQRYNILFENKLASTEVNWKDIAMEQQSNTKTEHYPISGSAPKMREWIGERQFKNLQNYDLSVTNRKFESGVAVKVEDVEDDRYGIYDGQIQDMGREAALLPQDLIVDALVAGGATLCYDGQYFFDSDHPIDPKDAAKGVQSNLTTTAPLNEANYAAGRAKMMTLKGENGNILRVEPTILVVPAALELTGRRLVYGANISQTGGSTQDNVMRGTSKLMVLPQLDGTPNGTTNWYLIDGSRSVKPILFQNRVAPAMQNPTMAAYQQFMKDELIYGARARAAVAFYLWQLAAKFTA
jgi:phage major head subunit gpT-like protein